MTRELIETGHFIVFLVALVVLGFVWGVYGGRAGLGFGFFAAGMAFALQEMIGRRCARSCSRRASATRRRRGSRRRPISGCTAASRPGASSSSLAERIITEEAERVSATKEAHEAMEVMQRSYPVPKSELEPRVYVTATDNYMELAARFVVPVRTARLTTHELTERVKARLGEAGIPISSSTSELTVYWGDAPPSGER